MGALIVALGDNSNSSNESLIDIHFIVSRIINRYIALSKDPVIEKYVIPWLLIFRDNLWRFCEKPSGLCSVSRLNEALEIFVRSYRDFLYGTGASIEIKERVYSFIKEIFDQVIDYVKKSYPEYKPLVNIDKPDKYRVEMFMKNIKEQDLRRLVIEIEGSEGLLSRYEFRRSREVLELPVGTYQIKVINGGNIIYRNILRVDRDSSLSIDLGRESIEKKSSPAKQFVSLGREIVVQVPKKRFVKRGFGLGRILRLLRRPRLETISIILLIILLIIDLLILVFY